MIYVTKSQLLNVSKKVKQRKLRLQSLVYFVTGNLYCFKIITNMIVNHAQDQITAYYLKNTEVDSAVL